MRPTQRQQSWQRLRQSLLDQIRDRDDVTCRVPGAEDPIDLAAGLRWLEDGLERGLDVDYRMVSESGSPVVWLQRWDPNEQRPPWPEEWPDTADERGRD